MAFERDKNTYGYGYGQFVEKQQQYSPNKNEKYSNNIRRDYTPSEASKALFSKIDQANKTMADMVTNERMAPTSLQKIMKNGAEYDEQAAKRHDNARTQINSAYATYYRGNGGPDSEKRKFFDPLWNKEDAALNLMVSDKDFFSGKKPNGTFSTKGYDAYKEVVDISGIHGKHSHLSDKQSFFLLADHAQTSKIAWEISKTSGGKNPTTGRWSNPDADNWTADKLKAYGNERIVYGQDDKGKPLTETINQRLERYKNDLSINISLEESAKMSKKLYEAPTKDHSAILLKHLGTESTGSEKNYNREPLPSEVIRSNPSTNEVNALREQFSRSKLPNMPRSENDIGQDIRYVHGELHNNISMLTQKGEGRDMLVRYVSKYAEGIANASNDPAETEKLANTVKSIGGKDGKWAGPYDNQQIVKITKEMAQNFLVRDQLAAEDVANYDRFQNREKGYPVYSKHTPTIMKDGVNALGLDDLRISDQNRYEAFRMAQAFAPAAKAGKFKDDNGALLDYFKDVTGNHNLTPERLEIGLKTVRDSASMTNYGLGKEKNAIHHEHHHHDTPDGYERVALKKVEPAENSTSSRTNSYGSYDKGQNNYLSAQTAQKSSHYNDNNNHSSRIGGQFSDDISSAPNSNRPNKDMSLSDIQSELMALKERYTQLEQKNTQLEQTNQRLANQLHQQTSPGRTTSSSNQERQPDTHSATSNPTSSDHSNTNSRADFIERRRQQNQQDRTAMNIG